MSFIKTAFWNEDEGRLRAGWRLVIQLIINIGLFVLILRLTRSCAGPLESQSPWRTVILAPIIVGVTLFSVWFAGRYLDRRYFSDFGLHLNSSAWWSDFGFGLALGTALPIGLAVVGAAAGLVTFDSAFTSGFPDTPFVLSVLLSACLYLCIGVFEEIARAYHIRNLLEGSNARWLGLRGAAVAAVLGASIISVLMHSGNIAFIFFVLVSATVNGLCYLLTGRIAIALASHAAWDFAMATLLGMGAQGDSSAATAFFIARLSNAVRMPDTGGTELALPAVFALIGLELLKLLLILGWVRLRYGKVKFSEDFAKPNLRSPKNGVRTSGR